MNQAASTSLTALEFAFVDSRERRSPFVLAQAHEETPAEKVHDAAHGDSHEAKDGHAASPAEEKHMDEHHDAGHDHAAPSAHAPTAHERTLSGPAESHTHAPAHGEHPGEYKLPAEFPNLYTLATTITGKAGHHEAHHGKPSPLQGPFAVHGPFWVNPLFAMFYASVFLVIVVKIMRNRSVENPTKAQVALEALFGGLYDFFGEVLGGEKNARKYVPYVGSLFIFIFLANFCGLIPLMKSPTAHFWTTFGLALCTFFFVNYQGIKEGGLWHYFHHLCGSPQDLLSWAFAFIILPLELIGTFVKPVSLSLRLAGNIFGEDKLLASFMGMGVMIAAAVMGSPTPGWGIPLHFPFLFLGTLTCVIQALVFSLLSAVYIALLLPHDDHHGDEGDHGHGHAEGHGHGHAAAH